MRLDLGTLEGPAKRIGCTLLEDYTTRQLEYTLVVYAKRFPDYALQDRYFRILRPFREEELWVEEARIFSITSSGGLAVDDWFWLGKAEIFGGSSEVPLILELMREYPKV